MAAVRTFTLPHYEAYPVQVALFKDVKNTEFLRSQLLAANPEFDYAFLDAAMVSGVLICFLWVHALLHGLSRHIHPYLSNLIQRDPSIEAYHTLITEAFKRFPIFQTV